MLSRVIHSVAQSGCRRLAVVAPRSFTSLQQPPPTTTNHSNFAIGRRPLSTSSDPQESTIASRYAVVDHSEAYEASMRGPHGKQLELAQIDGLGKDDAPFNPFWDEEEGDEFSEYDEEVVDEEEDDDEEQEEKDDGTGSPYNNDGSLRWKKSQVATFRAGAPAGGTFAIVELAGSQHKVTTDDVLIVNLLKPVDHYKVGSVHTLRNVMMVGSSHQTVVGMPYVKGAEVDVMVEEITQDQKVVVFKRRRRKNYRRKKGHRRDVTLLRIMDVRTPQEVGDHEHVQRENPQV